MTQPTSTFRFSDLTRRQLAELTSVTGHTLTTVVSTAIDRMYQQEIKTMTRNISITYAISTDSDSYTRESEHEQYIPQLIERIESEAQTWIATNYPAIEFGTRRDGRNFVDGDGQGIVEQLDDYINERWTIWFEEIVETA
jgi:hypothetical protein